MAILASICAGMIPATALIVGLICRAILVRTFRHLEDTQVIGGTPREIFEQKAEFDIEKKKQQLESRTRPVRARGVIV